jgi:tRNA dimethylallyltransferase
MAPLAPEGPRQRPKPAPPLSAIVGPTGSGKSELAMALAARLPVEIVVADSRQVYRGMNVGTAKPTLADRAAVPHHGLDLASPDHAFTVADWLAHVRPLIGEIAGRGAIPLIVGGTGLYVSALVDGYDFASQPWSPEIRERLAAELEAEGLEALAARLTASDPAAAARTDLRNPRRVLRALERTEAQGGGVVPRSEPYPGRLAMLGIARPREVLYRHIDQRAATLFANGLLEEAQALLAAGIAADAPPLSGHGYREAIGVLRGEWSLEEAIAATARRTRQYAKRQLSWFRRDPRIVWLPAGDQPAGERGIVERALDLLRRLTG